MWAKMAADLPQPCLTSLQSIWICCIWGGGAWHSCLPPSFLCIVLFWTFLIRRRPWLWGLGQWFGCFIEKPLSTVPYGSPKALPFSLSFTFHPPHSLHCLPRLIACSLIRHNNPSPASTRTKSNTWQFSWPSLSCLHFNTLLVSQQGITLHGISTLAS